MSNVEQRPLLAASDILDACKDVGTSSLNEGPDAYVLAIARKVEALLEKRSVAVEKGLKLDLDLARLAVEQSRARLDNAEARISELENQLSKSSFHIAMEQADERIALLEGLLADANGEDPDEVFEESCSPSIMDADGIPRAIAEILRGKGSVHSLMNLYLIIDTWAENQRQYAVRRAFESAARTHCALDGLERHGFVECDITSDLEFQVTSDGDFVTIEDVRKLLAITSKKI